MRASVLGPLTVTEGQASAVPTGFQPQRVLALLLLNESRVVPVSALMSELWGDEPPRSGTSMIQTYILKIRKKLAESLGTSLAELPREILRTRGRGYQLTLPEGPFDLRDYRGLESRGLDLFRREDYVTAVEVFDEAVALWDGDALVDLQHGKLLSAEVQRLEESRIALRQFQIDCELVLGRHEKVLSELAGLSAENPLDEGIHAKFIGALYLSGHRARALEAFGRLRTTMIEQLGLEPNGRLQGLHQAVLRCDGGLDVEGLRYGPMAAAG